MIIIISPFPQWKSLNLLNKGDIYFKTDADFCYSEKCTISSVMILYNKHSSIHICIIHFLLYQKMKREISYLLD